MARVTVEDCILKIPNRFELVMLAAQRSRELSVGAEMTVERDNDKNPVVGLREIADGTVDTELLGDAVVQGLQKQVDIDEPMETSEELLAVEEALSGFGEIGRALGGDAADVVDDADEALAAAFGEKPAFGALPEAASETLPEAPPEADPEATPDAT